MGSRARVSLAEPGGRAGGSLWNSECGPILSFRGAGGRGCRGRRRDRGCPCRRRRRRCCWAGGREGRSGQRTQRGGEAAAAARVRETRAARGLPARSPCCGCPFFRFTGGGSWKSDKRRMDEMEKGKRDSERRQRRGGRHVRPSVRGAHEMGEWAGLQLGRPQGGRASDGR